MEENLDVVALQNSLRLKFPESEKELVIFRRQYLQRIDAKHINWPCDVLLQNYDIQRWIHMWIKCFVPLESSTRHDYIVLSELLKRIEHAVEDVEEPDIYDPLFELIAELCQRVHAPAEEIIQSDVCVYYATPSPPSLLGEKTNIRIMEKPRVLSVGGRSGYRTWEAALVLASVIYTHCISQGLLRGRRVLELGTGTGLLSLLCASAEAGALVVSTDGDPDAISCLSNSIASNLPPPESSMTSILAGIYEWANDFVDTVIGQSVKESPFDLILGADVTYDPAAIPCLVKTIHDLIQPNPSTVAVIGATLRQKTTFDLFLKECENSGLRTCLIPYHTKPMSEQLALFISPKEKVVIVVISLGNHKYVTENPIAAALTNLESLPS